MLCFHLIFFSKITLYILIYQFYFSYCRERIAVWLVADFEALSYQVTTTFDTSCAAQILTARQLTIPRVTNWAFLSTLTIITKYSTNIFISFF